jgi:hypothetical protein
MTSSPLEKKPFDINYIKFLARSSEKDASTTLVLHGILFRSLQDLLPQYSHQSTSVHNSYNLSLPSKLPKHEHLDATLLYHSRFPDVLSVFYKSSTLRGTSRGTATSRTRQTTSPSTSFLPPRPRIQLSTNTCQTLTPDYQCFRSFASECTKSLPASAEGPIHGTSVAHKMALEDLRHVF